MAKSSTRPNVGKNATLINHLIGEKVRHTSKKPRTTHDRVLGVVTEPDAQIVFMDAGFQTKVGNQLIRRMNRTVRSTRSARSMRRLRDVSPSAGSPPTRSPQYRPGCVERVISPSTRRTLNKSKDSLLPLMAASMEVPVCGHRARVR